MIHPIHIGFDFNAANCNAVCGLWSGTKLRIFKEYSGYVDTPHLADTLVEDFSSHKIFAYPDATGIKRVSTNAHVSDIAILREKHFIIRAKTTNPRVRDRVASVNKAFERNKLTVDVDNCPELVECLEQQIFKQNGEPDKSSGFDHLVDALGYLVSYLMPVRHNRAIKLNYVS